MDTEFLKQFPPELTQGASTVLKKLEEEKDATTRSKLYGQLALILERLKADADNYSSPKVVKEVVADVEVTNISAK